MTTEAKRDDIRIVPMAAIEFDQPYAECGWVHGDRNCQWWKTVTTADAELPETFWAHTHRDWQGEI